MAELIDISNEKFWDILFDEACIEGQQAERIEKELKTISTTEAEIRAMAHQEFYDKVLNFEDYISPKAQIKGELMYSGRDITRMVRKVAEQLKEE